VRDHQRLAGAPVGAVGATTGGEGEHAACDLACVAGDIEQQRPARRSEQ
jgi:hypothetical protein